MIMYDMKRFVTICWNANVYDELFSSWSSKILVALHKSADLSWLLPYIIDFPGDER